ncbi:MAG TPA: hypothetical protein VE969_07345 [Pyrinomonadaceae bacterium]|nr:hypothetical protein [Pyrinomonadaceae bacterium]
MSTVTQRIAYQNSASAARQEFARNGGAVPDSTPKFEFKADVAVKSLRHGVQAVRAATSSP